MEGDRAPGGAASSRQRPLAESGKLSFQMNNDPKVDSLWSENSQVPSDGKKGGGCVSGEKEKRAQTAVPRLADRK